MLIDALAGISLGNIIQTIFGTNTLSDKNRPIRLSLSPDQANLQQAMLVQYVSGTESLCGGLDLDVICLTTSAFIPTKALLAMPIGIQLVTDQGALHSLTGIVTAASSGQSDGSLSVYRLRVQDGLALLRHRRNSRVMMDRSVLQVTDILFDEWRKKSELFSSIISLDTSGLKKDYVPQPFTYQNDESDYDFLVRHWRKNGISWFCKPSDSGLSHTLFLFDDPMTLAQGTAGTVRYHRSDATETRDTITSWIGARSLTSGSSHLQQWQPQSAQMTENSQMPKDKDSAGRLGALASTLEDAQMDTPTSNLSETIVDRFGLLQIQRHELASKCFYGQSTVRDLRVGEWINISEHPELDQHPENERQFIVSELHYQTTNNLPKGVQTQVDRLLSHSQWLPLANQAFDANDPDRYRNQFTAIRRGIPLVPAYDPKVDRPIALPQIATVVTPAGEEVHCDDWGRVKIRFNGMREDSHAHAGGAGSSNTDSDSAWVEVITPWAGSGYGAVTLPRKNESVIVEFIGGDPDRPIIMGRTFHGQRNPPQFSKTGSLPNNRHMSGIVSQEIKGSRINQLKFDDTNGQISTQLSSEHGASQLNLGFLTQPRDWTATKRGEGFELRSDEHGVVRAGKGMFISTDAQTGAQGEHLDINAAIKQLEQALEQVKALQKAATDGKSDPKQGYSRFAGLNEQMTGNLKELKQPSILMSAPTGVAITTPKNQTFNAGQNLTFIANKQIDLNANAQLTATGMQGISLYAQQGGLKAYANLGPIQIQAHNDTLQLASLKDLTMTSSEGKVTIAAQKEILIVCGGSYLKLSPDGAEIGSASDLKIKARYSVLAGAQLSVALPSFPTVKYQPINKSSFS